MAKWSKEKMAAWYDKNRAKINARRRELRASRKDVEAAKRKAYREANRERLNAYQREHRCAKLGLEIRDCVCEICGASFKTARKVQHTCGAKECQAELQRRRMRERYQKVGRSEQTVREKLRSSGVTEAEAVAVIAAQDSGDRERLWRESQTWTAGQRKFAERRYRAKYEINSHTTCGSYGFGGKI